MLDEVSLGTELAHGWSQVLLADETSGRRAWESWLCDGLELQLLCHSNTVRSFGLLGWDEAVWSLDCGFYERLSRCTSHKVLLDAGKYACVITGASRV